MVIFFIGTERRGQDLFLISTIIYICILYLLLGVCIMVHLLYSFTVVSFFKLEKTLNNCKTCKLLKITDISWPVWFCIAHFTLKKSLKRENALLCFGSVRSF